MIYTPDELPSPNSLKQSLGSFFRNLFKPPAQENYQPTALKNQNYNPFPGAPTPYSLESYQVKPNDNDLSQVANNLNVPLQQLVDNNNGSKTLPPTGSFISVNPAVNPNQTGAPVTGSFISGSGQVNTSNAAMNQSFVSSQPTGTFAPTATLKWEVIGLQNGISRGQLPPTVTAAAAQQLINPNTGQTFTQQDWESEGYVRDANGNYAKPASTTPTATPAAPSAFSQTAAAQQYAAQNTAFTEQMRWDPKRGRYVKIGQLLREGKLNLYDQQGNFRRRKREREEVAAAAPPPEAANAPETPTQVLALRLGSG